MAYSLKIAAATVWMESSGESQEGQRAVAHVLVNRLKTNKWGNTLAAVCLQSEQFSSWNTSDPNRHRLAIASEGDPTLLEIEGYVAAALAGTDIDPTMGATYYFDPAEAQPSWAEKLVKTTTIGHHDFYKDP